MDFFKNVNGQLCLRKTQSYYSQVQFEMAITGCKRADFVLYTEFDTESTSESTMAATYDIFVERIPSSQSHWEVMLEALKKFFNILTLELLTRRV